MKNSKLKMPTVNAADLFNFTFLISNFGSLLFWVELTRRVEFIQGGRRFSLSQRERAGVRESATNFRGTLKLTNPFEILDASPSPLIPLPLGEGDPMQRPGLFARQSGSPSPPKTAGTSFFFRGRDFETKFRKKPKLNPLSHGPVARVPSAASARWFPN